MGFIEFLTKNKTRLNLTNEEIKELVALLDYMIDDAIIGWEYDYQYNIKMDLDRRISIIEEFDPNLLIY